MRNKRSTPEPFGRPPTLLSSMSPLNEKTGVTSSTAEDQTYPFTTAPYTSHLLASSSKPRGSFYLRNGARRSAHRPHASTAEEQSFSSQQIDYPFQAILTPHSQSSTINPSHHSARLASALSRPRNRRSMARPDGAEIYHIVDPSYSGYAPPSPSGLSSTSRPSGAPAPPPEFSKAYHDAQGQLHDPEYRTFDVQFAPHSRVPSSSRLPNGRSQPVQGRRSSQVGLLAASELGRRSVSSMSHRDSLVVGDVDEKNDEDEDYDSDDDVTLGRRMEERPSSFSVPMPITTSSPSYYARSRHRFSASGTLASDSGYAGTAPSSSPPDVLQEESSDAEAISPETPSPHRPQFTREMSRDTLYPRTPARQSFSQAPTEVTHVPISIFSTPLAGYTNGEIDFMGVPGTPEKDSPYREIVLPQPEEEKHSSSPFHRDSRVRRAARRGEEKRRRKKDDIASSHRDKKEHPRQSKGDPSDALASPKLDPTLEKPLSRANNSRAGSPGAAYRPRRGPSSEAPSITLSSPDQGRGTGDVLGYIPSHHGKSKSLRPGAIPVEEEYTPTCVDGLKRSWQSFKLTLRFGAFRTRRRIKRRVGLMPS